MDNTEILKTTTKNHVLTISLLPIFFFNTVYTQICFFNVQQKLGTAHRNGVMSTSPDQNSPFGLILGISSPDRNDMGHTTSFYNQDWKFLLEWSKETFVRSQHCFGCVAVSIRKIYFYHNVSIDKCCISHIYFRRIFFLQSNVSITMSFTLTSQRSSI